MVAVSVLWKQKSNNKQKKWLIMINPLVWFFGILGHVPLDRNLRLGYDTLLLRLIPGDLLSACPQRQFHTLPGILNSRFALSNSYS